MQASPNQDRQRAILFVVAAVGLATCQDAVVKGVSGSLPVHEAVIFRSLAAMPMVLAWLLWKGAVFGVFPPRLLALVLLRSFILGTAYFAFVLSIATLPLATSVSIYFTMPFFVAALAGWSLGERVPPHRWIAMVVGFAGVLLMVRPGSETFEPAALLALYSALAYALGQLLGRHLSQRIEPAVIVTWQNLTYLAMAVLIGLVTPLFANYQGQDPTLSFLLRPWVWPSLQELLLLILIGIVSTFAASAFIMAYRHAEANFVAPFEYTALLWAVVLGLVFFGDFPDLYTWLGAAVVVGAGIWMVLRDKRQIAS